MEDARCEILVTGGSGKLGAAIVAALSAGDRRVRTFSRRVPQGASSSSVQRVLGDLDDADAVDRAVRGAQSVVHAGAAMSGDEISMQRATVGGTANLLDAMRRHGVRRLVHISSLSVVDWASNDLGAPVTEDAVDEPHPEMRGPYTQTKLQSERLVRGASSSGMIDAVILRPGLIWGGAFPPPMSAACRRIGPFNFILGDGNLKLPLVHVDDVVEAVIKSLSTSLASGTIIHLVDPAVRTQNDVLKACELRGMEIRIPKLMLLGMGWLSEMLWSMSRRPSPVNVYRLRSALARIEFRSDRARELLGWVPHGNSCAMGKGASKVPGS